MLMGFAAPAPLMRSFPVALPLSWRSRKQTGMSVDNAGEEERNGLVVELTARLKKIEEVCAQSKLLLLFVDWSRLLALDWTRGQKRSRTKCEPEALP